MQGLSWENHLVLIKCWALSQNTAILQPFQLVNRPRLQFSLSLSLFLCRLVFCQPTLVKQKGLQYFCDFLWQNIIMPIEYFHLMTFSLHRRYFCVISTWTTTGLLDLPLYQILHIHQDSCHLWLGITAAARLYLLFISAPEKSVEPIFFFSLLKNENIW